jgi:hypothetical protein
MVPIRVTSAKLKPLIPAGGLKFDSEKVLKSLQREVLKQIKGKILQETFSARAKRALSEGMKVTVGQNSITVVATHPAFIPLLQGQRMGQMKWLTKAQAPIPIVTDKGELIFRSATPKSMSDGKWVHPGRQPTTVIAKAKKAAREVVKKRLNTELRKQLRDSLRAASR